MTAEQIQLLRDLVAWPSELADQSATAEAIRAAIALAEQTCETCAHQKPGMKDWCQKVAVLCATVGHRCGRWEPKEQP